MRQPKLVVQIIKESLGSLASAERVDELVTRALAQSGLADVPSGAEALEAWVRGPLSSVLEEELGPTAAGLLAAELGILSQRTGLPTHSREQLTQTARTELTPKQRALINATRTKESDRTQPIALMQPPASPHVARPRVLVATDDRALEAQLRQELKGTAKVEPLVDGAHPYGEAKQATRSLVLIDAHSEFARRVGAVELRAMLPIHAIIVIWGPTPESWRDMESETDSQYKWEHCSKEATTDDLLPLCRMLLSKLLV